MRTPVCLWRAEDKAEWQSLPVTLLDTSSTDVRCCAPRLADLRASAQASSLTTGGLVLQMCALQHQAFQAGSGKLNSDLHTSAASTYPLSYFSDTPPPPGTIISVILYNVIM